MADFKPLEFMAPVPTARAEVKGAVRVEVKNSRGLSIGITAAVLAKLKWPDGTVLAPTLAECELKLQPLAGSAIRVQFPKKGGGAAPPAAVRAPGLEGPGEAPAVASHRRRFADRHATARVADAWFAAVS